MSLQLNKSLLAIAIGIVVVSSFLYPSKACRFPAIYNFGDSNSDTGSVSAAFGRVPPPYGETFFGKPSGRYSDGLLLIDFIAQSLGSPFLSAYLDSIESNFSHGANFAASGSTVEPVNAKLYGAGFNPLSLNIQLLQFEQLKDRTEELYEHAKSDQIISNLPKPEDFSKALYTLDSGQNDLHFGFETMSEKQVKGSIPYIVNRFALSIKTLYQRGARTFWIHNTGPIGCLPNFVISHPPLPENTDENGCIKSYNDVAQEFNKQLKEEVSKLRTQLSNTSLVYVDIYSAKYSLISDAKQHGKNKELYMLGILLGNCHFENLGTLSSLLGIAGFVNPLGYCCKHKGDSSLRCWDSKIVNGSVVFATSCDGPSKYISWDGIHWTEAANKWMANHILDGSFSDPHVPLAKACLKPML
ncbi:hypothetical protein UlMin_040182 [Ulmus minor]